MIDGIRNWLGDVASGKIKDAQIELSQSEATLFRRQLDEAIVEISDLTARNAQLVSENHELKAKLVEFSKIPEIVGDSCPYCRRNSGFLVEVKPKPGYAAFGTKQGYYECRHPDCGKSYDKEMPD